MGSQKTVGGSLHAIGGLIFDELADDGSRPHLFFIDAFCTGQAGDTFKTGDAAACHGRAQRHQQLRFGVEAFE